MLVSNPTSLGLHDFVLVPSIKDLFLNLKIQLRGLLLSSGCTEVFPFTLKVVILFLLFQLSLPRKIVFKFHKFHVIPSSFFYLPIAYGILDVLETSFVAHQTGLEIVVTLMFSLESGYCFTKNSSLKNSSTTVMFLRVGHVNFLN